MMMMSSKVATAMSLCPPLEPEERHRVFLADDHPVVLAGVQALVAAQPDLEVVGMATDTKAAITGIAASAPHIAVLDMSIPGANGLALMAYLRQHFPQVATLALTVHEDSAYVHRSLEAGARGFILKRSAADELINAIRAVLAGGLYIDQTMSAKILSIPGRRAAPNGPLSDRELEVVKLVARGFSNKEIAGQLQLSVKTVETYRARATEKLELRSRAALVRHATIQGWMSD